MSPRGSAREDKGDSMESVSGVGTGEADRREWNEEEGEDVDTDHKTVYRGEEHLSTLIS